MRAVRDRRATALATVLFGITILLFAASAWGVRPGSESAIPASDFAFGTLFLVWPFVGWVIAVNLPRNPLGWIYLVFPGLIALGSGSSTLGASAGRSEEEVLAWAFIEIGSVAFAGGFMLFLSAGLMLFPDGKPINRLWRWGLWGTALYLVGFLILATLFISPICVNVENATGTCFQHVENPIALTVLGGEDFLDVFTWPVILAVAVASVASLVVRYRRSHGDERLQVKWVAWVALLGLVAVVVGSSTSALGIAVSNWVGIAAVAIALVGMPVAIGIAIFKYRLYEIDRIINRTVVYVIVVGLLGVVFAVGAVWLPTQLPTGNSSLAVAASTLAVAALFNPLRRRTQRFVDRRFYRSRYNAQQVADEFSARLREQIDPDAVTAEWEDVVQRTLQPSAVAVWLREGS